ncbi:ANTAR domain-containing protein [bacterium 210820-DFI.6.37]|nr:ANTAR domain-containing protein [bacterium 210820-DFI.6.37]
MEKVLLISKNGKTKTSLQAYLMDNGDVELTTVTRGAIAREVLLNTSYDLLIINSPLEDEFGDELAALASMKTRSGVIILIKNSLIDSKAAKMEKAGVMVVGKPVIRGILSQAIKFAQVAKNRIITLQEENIKLQDRLDQIKLINRAKWVLVKYLNMTEDQAHKYIEQQAMERRISKGMVARKVLAAYEQ